MNYSTSSGSGQSFGDDFNILNYLDRLTKTKESSKYICPACGGHNLSISKTGKYDCYDCGETHKIASILTRPEREHQKFRFDLDRKLKENLKEKRRQELEEKYSDYLFEDEIDRFLAIEEGASEATQTSQPGERLRLAIQGYLLEQDPLAKIAMKPAIMSKFSLGRAEFDAAVIEVYSLCSSSKLEIYDIKDFLSTEFRSQGFLVEGVPFNGVTVLGGEYGSGKSTLAYWLAKSVLTGNKFLADSPSQTGKVLIVNSDEGRADSQDRMIDMDFPDSGCKYLARFKIEQHWHDLEQLVAQDRPKLVLVDSFCGIHGRSFDENSSLSGLTIERFNNLAETYNCAIVVLHHTNKQGKLRGSSRILDIAHSVLLVDKRPTSRILRSEKVRGVEPFEYEFGLTDEGEIKLLKNNSNKKVPETIYERVLKLLEDNYPTSLGVSDICNISSLSKRQVWDVLKKLKAAGKAKQSSSKCDKRVKVWSACVASRNLPPSPPLDVIVESSNSSEITTVYALEPSQKYETEYETSSIEDQVNLLNSEESLLNSPNPNPNTEAEHSEITRPNQKNTQGGEGKHTTDNPVLHTSSNDFPTVSWVTYKGEKWNVIEQYEDLLTLTPYGKMKGSPVYCRAIDCEYIEYKD